MVRALPVVLARSHSHPSRASPVMASLVPISMNVLLPMATVVLVAVTPTPIVPTLRKDHTRVPVKLVIAVTVFSVAT